jgi:hypothetical protein
MVGVVALLVRGVGIVGRGSAGVSRGMAVRSPSGPGPSCVGAGRLSAVVGVGVGVGSGIAAVAGTGTGAGRRASSG